MDNHEYQRHWDAYKVLIETRNLEINLFWQRSNYFLVLNTALAVGFFNVKEDAYRWALVVFGFLTSLLWIRVSLGAKYWQAKWEQRLREYEIQFFPSLEFFGASPKRIEEDAEKGLDFFKAQWPKKILYQRALRKPSVSFSMILLAVMFLLGWLAVGCISLYLHRHVPHCFI